LPAWVDGQNQVDYLVLNPNIRISEGMVNFVYFEINLGKTRISVEAVM